MGFALKTVTNGLKRTNAKVKMQGKSIKELQVNQEQTNARLDQTSARLDNFLNSFKQFVCFILGPVLYILGLLRERVEANTKAIENHKEDGLNDVSAMKRQHRRP